MCTCVHICTSGAKESLPEASDSSLTSSSSFHSSLFSFCWIQHSSVTPPLHLLTFTSKNILDSDLLALRKPSVLHETNTFFSFLHLITLTGQLEPVAAGWCPPCKVQGWSLVFWPYSLWYFRCVEGWHKSVSKLNLNLFYFSHSDSLTLKKNKKKSLNHPSMATQMRI